MAEPAFPWMQKTVAAVSWNDVEMKMELCLIRAGTHVVNQVDSRRRERFHQHPAYGLSGGHEMASIVLAEVKKVSPVSLGNDEAVPGGHGQQIHERDDIVSFEDDFGGTRSCHDVAKHAPRDIHNPTTFAHF